MKTDEMKKMISYLHEKKMIAITDLERGSDGEPQVKSAHYQEYKSIFASLVSEISMQKPAYAIQYGEVTKNELYYDLKLDEYEGIINAIEKEIDLGLIKEHGNEEKMLSDSILLNIFDRFHCCCRQMRNRYSNRDTLEVTDEYDVQDLLHVLLKLHFEDIRPEEYTPSYAGSAARMDFLLNETRDVIEVKKTRSGLKDKEIGNQLIEDIARYKSHQQCKQLYCFVYDPEGLIGNPKGIEKDLSGLKDGINVRVIIRP